MQFQLYVRLVATVDSEHFLTRLKSLQQASSNGTSYEFPFKEATGFLLYFVGLYLCMLSNATSFLSFKFHNFDLFLGFGVDSLIR